MFVCSMSTCSSLVRERESVWVRAHVCLSVSVSVSVCWCWCVYRTTPEVMARTRSTTSYTHTHMHSRSHTPLHRTTPETMEPTPSTTLSTATSTLSGHTLWERHTTLSSSRMCVRVCVYICLCVSVEVREFVGVCVCVCVVHTLGEKHHPTVFAHVFVCGERERERETYSSCYPLDHFSTCVCRWEGGGGVRDIIIQKRFHTHSLSLSLSHTHTQSLPC